MPKTPKATSRGKEGEIILPRNGHHTDDTEARPGARLRQLADTVTPQDALIEQIAQAHRKPPPGGPNRYPPHSPKALFRSRPSTPHQQEAIWRNWLAAGPVLAYYGVPRKLLEQIGFPLGGDPEDLYGCHPAMPDSPEYFGNLDYHVQYLFLRERQKYEDRIEQLRQERDEWRLKCVSQRTL